MPGPAGPPYVTRRRSSRLPPLAVASAFSPTDIDWYSLYWAEGSNFEAFFGGAPADGGAVGTWADEEAGGFGDITQATAAAKPTYDAANPSFNGKPTVNFDGTDDLLRNTTGGPSGAVAMFLVAQFNVTGKQFAIDSAAGASRKLFGVTTGWVMHVTTSVVGSVEDTTAHAFEFLFNGASSYLDLDGVQDMAKNPGTDAYAGLTLGASYNDTDFANLDVAMLGVKAGDFTAQESDDLVAWSRDHYTTP